MTHERPGNIPPHLVQVVDSYNTELIAGIRAQHHRDPLGEDVLTAMADIPRHEFIPIAALYKLAFEDMAIGIEPGSTISQPDIVAMMTDRLAVQRDHRVLEIGTGTGWQAAILGRLAKEVYTVEISESLVEFARANLAHVGATNVHVIHADGHEGYAAGAPYDRILFTAALKEIPDSIIDQLAEGGKLIAPVQLEKDKDKELADGQMTALTVIDKQDGQLTSNIDRGVWFVPMRKEE